MKTSANNLYKFGGIVAGSAAMASLSAYVTTKYLLKMALDREEPRLMKLAEKKVSGSMGNTEFARALATSGKRLAAKPNETVEIIAHDGETLVGHWIPCENPERIIIAVHGWRASWTQTFGLVSEAWEQNHCNVLYVEQRGTNNSGGDTISFGLIERFDCLDWIRWVNARFGTDLPIYLCGVSMGAATVLMAAGLDLPSNVHGIIADCGFTSPHAIWKHVANNNLHIAFGLRGAIADELLKQKIQMGSDESTVEALQSSTIPVMLIHGTDDHFVPVEMTYENYKACAGPKRLLIVPGADHGMSYFVEREKYEEEIKRFWRDFD